MRVCASLELTLARLSRLFGSHRRSLRESIVDGQRKCRQDRQCCNYVLVISFHDCLLNIKTIKKPTARSRIPNEPLCPSPNRPVKNAETPQKQNSKYSNTYFGKTLAPFCTSSCCNTTPEKSSFGCGIMPHSNLPHFEIRKGFLANRMTGGVQSEAEGFAVQSGLAANRRAPPHADAHRPAGSATHQAAGTPNCKQQ